MDKIISCIDTSALISLEATSKLELATKIFSFKSTQKVKEELIEINKTLDDIGAIAENILNSSLIEFIDLDNGFKNETGEIETINLANKIKADFVIMDDAKARKKLQNKTKSEIKFSPFVLFVLYENKMPSYEECLSAIDKMKIKREWENNLIIEYAKILFEKEPKALGY